MTPIRFRHVTGLRALATAALGLALAALGGKLVYTAFTGAEGPVFVALAGLLVAAGGVAVGTLPWRIATLVTNEDIRVGWMFGRRVVPWGEVRRVVVGPLGSGKERDPTAVTLLLRSGEEVLFATLGRTLHRDHAAAREFLEAAKRAGVAVEDVLAPPEEREERERKWREARTRGER